MDVRVRDLSAWERTRRAIEAIAAAEDVPGTRTELRLWPHRPPMPWTGATDRLAALVAESAAEMDTRIDTVATMGAPTRTCSPRWGCRPCVGWGRSAGR
jgi:hypothetical protein